MQVFEIKRIEKSLYTRSDAEEPTNFHGAGIGQPNPASAEDKKGHWQQQQAARRSKVLQTS